ncbi:886_t:CDS:1, partial [Cetraspora pellucida]
MENPVTNKPQERPIGAKNKVQGQYEETYPLLKVLKEDKNNVEYAIKLAIIVKH